MPFLSVLNEIVRTQLLNQYLEEPSICAWPKECKATLEVILMTNYKVLPFFFFFFVFQQKEECCKSSQESS